MGTQKNRLDETVLLSTINMFKLMDKKIITILRKLFLLNWPYVQGLDIKPIGWFYLHRLIYQPAHGILVLIAYVQKPPLNTHVYVSSCARKLIFGLSLQFLPNFVDLRS